jgi:multiple sugar transport system substrate-binding protein
MNAASLSRRAMLAVGASALVASCAPRRDARVLRVAYSPITFRVLYEAVARGFERAHPGFAVELVPVESYDAMLERDVRLSLVGDELDVSHAGVDTLRFYVERRLALPLDDLLKRDGASDLSRHATIGVARGTTYALPFAISVPALYFNKALLSRVGADPERFSGTWDEVLSIGARLSRLPPPISSIFYDPGVDLDWQALVFSRGGTMMNAEETRVAFGGAEGLWSAELLQAFGRAGQKETASANARVALVNGLLGFLQNTSSNIRKFRKQAGSIPLGMTILPVAPGGTLPAAGTMALIPAKDPARQSLAWTYVRFACGPVGQTIMASTSGYQSFNQKAWDAPNGIASIVARDPLYARAHAALSYLQAYYAFPGPNSGRVERITTDMMRRVILGEAEPHPALAQLCSEADRLLETS